MAPDGVIRRRIVPVRIEGFEIDAVADNDRFPLGLRGKLVCRKESEVDGDKEDD